jgi:hypothetical protein
MTKALELVLGGTLKLLAREIEQHAGAYFSTTINGITITGKAETMAYTLPADKVVDVKVSYVDANQNPAVVDGPVQWASSNTDIAMVTPNASDSQLANIAPGGVTIGTCQISCMADADLGEGVRQLITTMDLTVVAGEAVAGTIEPTGPAHAP